MTALLGSLLGTAVGDAIGLPYEGLSRRRAARLLGTPDRHRLFFGRGMVSDDTEHTCLVAQALIVAGGNHEVFLKRLARGLRLWMLGLPAGVGFATLLRTVLPDEADELLDVLAQAAESASAGESTAAFADSMGQATGVSGYTYHCVPVAIHAWLRNPRDFRTAIIETVACGGDTDTTAAIVGGIVGSGVGKAGIPAEWISGIREWPRSVAWMEGLEESLYRAMVTGDAMRAPRLPVVLRNALFLVIVLLHGIRRLGPPY